MQRTLTVVGWVVMSAASACPAATSRYAITPAQVSAAIGNTNSPVSSGDVTLLSDVVASTPAPRLHVQAADQVAADQFAVRLACDTTDECLPFVVTVQSTPQTRASLVALAGSGSMSSAVATQQLAIRSGVPAVLLLDGKHVHIQIPVVTLQNGAVGQRIRVTEKSTRRMYTAVVVNDRLLQGRL